MKEIRELHITAKELSYHSFAALLNSIAEWCERQNNEVYDHFHFRSSYSNGFGICVVCSKEVSENEPE